MLNVEVGAKTVASAVKMEHKGIKFNIQYWTLDIQYSNSGNFGLFMKDFKKYYLIPAPPEELYLALTNPLTIQLWSGEGAEMSDVPGSEFSLWDGSIVGKNIEFVPGKKIVQQWYFGEQPEASIVTIKLHADGEGTSVELRHTNIPDGDYQDIVDGWNDVYFGSLRDFY